MKDIFIVASAGLMVFLMLRTDKRGGGIQPDAGTYWISDQGNTGFPEAARTRGEYVAI